MAQDITSKCSTFVQRYSSAVVESINALNNLRLLKLEWDDNGYAAGAPAVSGTNYNITDAHVQAVLPAATAAQLNSAVGGVASVLTTLDANLGYLIVLKP